MTKKHYHHHIEEATGEPTVIEIGEPYPEELDPALHEFNRIKGRVADAALALRRLNRAGHMPPTEKVWQEHWRRYQLALDEFEKMVPVASLEGGEELDPALHRGNDLAHNGMRIIRECIERIRGANNSTLTDKNKRDVTNRELGNIQRALREYEMVCGE